MKLHLIGIVDKKEHTRSFDDRRFKIVRYIVEYRGDDGFEYRKAFESKSIPTVPEVGTHKELNAMAVQY